jgi:hypothetical protein
MTTRVPLSARNIALTLVLLLLGSLVAVPSWATSTDGTRAFRAGVSPSACVTPDATTTFQMTLTNTSNNITLGSANVTPGFTVGAVESVTAGTARVTASAAGSVIELRNLGLRSGQSVVVSFTAAPSAGTYPFTIVAKQRNDFNGPPGNDLQLFGATPTVEVRSCLELAFLTQPADAQTGQPVPGALADWPQVAVSNGQTGVGNVAVTITLQGGSEDGALSTDSTITATTGADGVATFANLRVTASGEGYELVASTTGAASTTSDPFDVDDDVATCLAGETCAAAVTSGGYDVRATGTASLGVEGRLTLSFFSPTGCDAPVGVSLSRLPAGVTVSGTDLAAKSITFTIDEATRKLDTDNGVDSYQVCAEPVGRVADGETLPFRDRYTGELVTGADNPGDLDRGWLPDCSSSVPAPCVSQRRGDGSGGVLVTVDFGSRFRMS